MVLHSSAVLEWIYAERATETLAQGMETVITRGAWVPAHWRLEVASVLEHNTRHRRHDHIFRNETLRDLSLLAIQADAETHGRAWEMTLEIAVRRNVSVYTDVRRFRNTAMESLGRFLHSFQTESYPHL